MRSANLPPSSPFYSSSVPNVCSELKWFWSMCISFTLNFSRLGPSCRGAWPGWAGVSAAPLTGTRPLGSPPLHGARWLLEGKVTRELCPGLSVQTLGHFSSASGLPGLFPGCRSGGLCWGSLTLIPRQSLILYLLRHRAAHIHPHPPACTAPCTNPSMLQTSSGP